MQEPNWQPIEMLPAMSKMLSTAYQSSSELVRTLQAAIETPHVMDDETIDRVIGVYTEQLDHHWVYEEQLTRWAQGELSKDQRDEVERLSLLSGRLKASINTLLGIARQIQPNTIDKILAMDDAELAINVLTGKLKPSH